MQSRPLLPLPDEKAQANIIEYLSNAVVDYDNQCKKKEGLFNDKPGETGTKRREKILTLLGELASEEGFGITRKFAEICQIYLEDGGSGRLLKHISCAIHKIISSNCCDLFNIKECLQQLDVHYQNEVRGLASVNSKHVESVRRGIDDSYIISFDSIIATAVNNILDRPKLTASP